MVDTGPIAQRVARLSESKRLLLERWLDGAVGEPRPEEEGPVVTAHALLPRVVPVPEDRYLSFPLTDVQQAYWVGRNAFFELGDVASHSYLEIAVSKLDLARLERALRRLVEHHEMLRAIVDEDGRQRILPDTAPYEVQILDLRGLDSQRAAAELEATRQRMSHQVLPTDRWPLFEVCASRLSGEHHRLHIGFDILIADVRSVRILGRDLGALYAQPDIPLEPLELSFRDYVLAEQSLRLTTEYRRSRDYWLARLPSLPPSPELPRAVLAAREVLRYFVRRAGRLEASHWGWFKATAAAAGLSASNALLAAFAEVVARWAASPRFTLNLTLYNRLPLHPQVDHIVGDFTSLTLLAVDGSGREPFEARAQALQKQLWADLDHRLFNGVEVLREIARRDGSRLRAVMPVVFTSNLAQDGGGDPWREAGLGELTYGVSQTPQVWLDLQVAEEAGALVFNWDAVESLFPDGLVQEMFDAYLELLHHLANEEAAWQDQAPRSAGKPRALSSHGGTAAAAARAGEFLSSLLSRESILPDDDLLALGVSSIDLIRLANALGREFGVRPDMEAFFEARNILEIAKLYSNGASGEIGTGLTRSRDGSPQLLVDPADREAFKQRQPGLRADLDDQLSIELPAPVRGLLADPAVRRSHRRFLLDPIDLTDLGGLLGCLERRTLDGEPKYWYPSAGALYPVQVYLHCKPGRITGVPTGTYYYNPGTHRLVLLTAGARLDRSEHGWMNREVFDQAAFSLFLVGEEQAIRPMYGNLTRDFCMYEAGAMGQLLMMVAPGYGLGLCAIGRVDLQDESRSWLALGGSHVLLHTLLGGRIDAAPRADEDAVPLPSILPQPMDGAAFPASFAQERLWFLQQFEPAVPFYNIPKALRLRGRLQAAALARSLAEIERRHDALRTAFRVVDERLTQVVEPARPSFLPVMDLTSVPVAVRPTEALEQVGREVRRPFDLERGPLLRSLLLRLAEDEHVLLVVVHHIVADGWSAGILVRELAAGYEAFVAGRLPALPDLPVQYPDYAVWQRRILQGKTLEAQLAYWRRQLDGPLPILQLPIVRQGRAAHTFGGDTVPLAFSSAEAEDLQALSRREGVTLFVTLLAAFEVLLGRYTGELDILVGSPFANRNREELEGLIGLFANTLVLRTSLNGDPSFRELLARVRRVSLAAQAHGELPFEKLVQDLNPDRDLSHTPFFQVWFTLQNAGMPTLHLPGLALESLEVSNGTAQFDLTLDLWPSAGGLQGCFEYNRDLFSKDSVQRAADHFRALLAGALADPGRRLSELPLLSEAELHQMLVEANEPSFCAPYTGTLQEIFERQVERSPDAPAVLCGTSCLNFRELNRRANQVAHRLRRLGVGPETLVGVYLNPSPEVALALLGTLKAGGAFLPLDVPLPAARLASLLETAAVPVLLTQMGLLEQVSAGGTAVICLDAEGAILARQEEADPPAQVDANGLAYAFFTSGSTGEPKAVLLSQRALASYVLAMAGQLGLAPGDRVLQLAPFGFDVLIEELFPTWLSGAAVVFPEGGRPLSGTELLRCAEDEGATALEVSTVLWHQMVDEISRGRRPPASLRRILVGCGKVDRRHLSRWQGTGIQLLHVYGLTETAVTSTLCRPAVQEEGAGRDLPLGQPLANTRLYLLDSGLQPVPAGVRGEIHIAGDGLARGYLDSPAQTAEKFIPDPFASQPGMRLFRTGDEARHTAGDSLEFLGRIDTQVKLRGYRIELGEIEASLAGHPGIRQAAARVWEQSPGDERIVACVATAPGHNLEEGDLRSFLRGRLPSYMVPSVFIFLADLPVTAHGKLDRGALPAPPVIRPPEVDAVFMPPRTTVEERLADLAAELLGIERLGVFDNFFDLGGHSLLATRLASRIEMTFQVELPLRLVFEAPTVAGLAQALTPALAEAAGPISRRQLEGDAPLSFAQDRLWLLHRLEPLSCAYNLPAPVRLSGLLDKAALAWSIARLIDRHEVLRTSFPLVGDRPVQAIAAAKPQELPLIDLGALPTAVREWEASRLAAEDARRPFDLLCGRVLRAALLCLEPRDHVLVLTLHHIAADGWSMGILLRELAELYAAGASRRAPRLPQLSIQYADFALWQRGLLQGEFLASQLAYWRQRLQDAPPGVELPGDRLRPVAQTFRGATLGLQLAAPLAASLKSVGRKENATLFMTLLAAFQALLGRYTGNEDVVVGSTIANRNRVETEPLVGFFVNTLVLRTPLCGGPGFRQLLARVREVTLGAYAHQDLPFEILVDHLQPARDPSRNPLFQIMFSFDVVVVVEQRLPDLVLNPLGIHTGAAQFDLTLDLSGGATSVVGSWTYSTELFDGATIARLAGHFQTLLQGVVDSPDRPLAELPLLTAAELCQLLVEWNDTGPSRGEPGQLLDELFAAQAARTPDAPALLSPGALLTYRQLDARANWLAHHLRGLGIGPEVMVGLATDRSPEMATGILGILKAGGACLPLDPDLPRERLAFLLADSRIGALLTQERLASRLPPTSVPTILLDGERDIVERVSEEAPARLACPANLAYATYTSGSTGLPKGTLLTHASLVGFTRDMAARFDLRPEDRFLQVAPLGFDVLLEELFPAWASGAAVVLAGLPSPASSFELTEVLEQQEVTALELPAAFWRQWIRDLSRSEGRPPASLRLVIVGCEPPSLEALRVWRSFRLPLIHVFGLTEATVTSAVFQLPAGAELEGGGRRSALPIGRPVSAVRAYVLGINDGQPVPIGVPGELYLGGGGLARGYLDRPRLTADRFVPDPWSGETGARLYRTGDWVRWSTDSDLEFLGRLDQQVNVHGFRIEVAEVEAALRRHPAVLEAVVVTERPSAASESQRLVAYLQFQDGEPPTLGGLRGFLGDKLPAWMIPSLFLTLSNLPLTAHGKLDRERLPALEERRSAATEPDSPPRSPLEHALADLWREALGVPVGRDDNFFELGGDSMLCIQIAACGREWGIALTPRDLFQHQTIAELAAVLREERAEPPPPLPQSARAPRARTGFTVADFPQARLSQEDLERFIARISGRADP